MIGFFAWHHWLVVTRGEQRDRWEIWQKAGAGGEWWGHLHRNLMPPERGVGWGPSWLVQAWQSQDAHLLAQRIESAPQTYPFRDRYSYWPGPNSNTFAQWVLDERRRLSWRGLGGRFLGPVAPFRDALLGDRLVRSAPFRSFVL